jgi:glyoxylase-like metal-dependent hydrolase (beta-lactamase superfamily II)
MDTAARQIVETALPGGRVLIFFRTTRSLHPEELHVALYRREFLYTTASAFAGLAASESWLFGQAPAQTPPPAVTKFEDIRRNVGIFTGRGGTIGWLATPAGAIAVDAQFPDTAKACVEGLQQKSPKGIQLLINTHYHGDHTGGNPAFRPIVKSIVQQERCAKLHKDTTAKAGTAAQQAYADITFGESWSHELGDEKVWGHFYGAGHTGGDAVIFFEKANVVHMGDLMFNRLHPRVDRPSGASVKSWIGVLERVSKRHADATFIFGHAKPNEPITGIAKDLMYFRDYLTAVMDHVRKGISAKKSLEEILKVEAIPGFPDHVSSGQVLTLAGVLTAAYEEQTGKPAA